MTSNWRTYGVAALLCASFGIVSGCGSSSNVTATIKVTSMATRGSSRVAVHQSRSGGTAVDTARLLKSSTQYSFAVIDGAKFQLTKLRAELAGSDDVKDVTASGDLTFTDSSSQVVALNQAVDWPTGTFRGISVHLNPSWSLKAYCRTGYTGTAASGKLVYTRAADIGTVDCTAGATACDTIPADYDFHTIGFLSNYAGYATDYQQETHTNFTVNAGDAPVVSLLYDGSYNISCWDGGTWDDSKAIGGMVGFNDSTDHATRIQYFPDGHAAFGSSYLPIFGYVTNDASEAAPTARTFLTSPSGTNTDFVQGASFTFKTKPVVTLVYKSDGTIFAGSTRNYQGNGASSPFDLDLEGFTPSATTGSDFYSSGWYYNGTGAPTFIRNRKFTAFTPAATAGNAFEADATDGSQCGQNFTDFQNNNASRACHGGTQVVWWYEVTR